jgi:transposase
MQGVTAAGLDVHARSTEAAAINVVTGEVEHRRFVGSEVVALIVGWLAERPGPVRAVYEAGPTGFGLYRRRD